MKIYIEVPDNWLDGDKCDDLSFITRTCKQVIQQKLTDQILEEVLKNTPVPTIEITGKEIKDRMLDILAERALKNEND